MPENDILEPPVTDKTFLKLIQAIQTVSIKSAVVDNTDTESSTKALSAGQGFKLQREVDADRGENSAYDPTATYDVGDFCINDNALYKCNTAISTPEAWDASHWDAVNLKGLDMSVTSLNTYLGGIILVEKVDSSSFNVGASTTYSSSVDVSKTGYTAIGVVGNTVSTGAMVVLELIVGVDTITFSVWNRTSSAISSAKLGLYILYLKNMS